MIYVGTSGYSYKEWKGKFYPETNPEGNGGNIVAEIPGTDLANEVVIIGAHFDSYP